MNLLIPEAKNPELNMRCDSFFVCVLLPLISFLELLSATVSHTAMCVAILFFIVIHGSPLIIIFFTCLFRVLKL